MVSPTLSLSVYSDGSVGGAARVGTYCIVNNDYDQLWGDEYIPYNYHVSRNTRNRDGYFITSGRAVPATASFINDENVLFTCGLQYWIHEMNCHRVGVSQTSSQAIDWFKNMWRKDAFMTNYAGFEDDNNPRENCLTGENFGKGFPVIQPMACGGTLLRVNGEGRKAGEDVWLVDAINPFVDYLQYNYVSHPYLFFIPTQSKRVWYNKYGVRLENVPDGGDKNPTKKEEYYQEPLWFYGETPTAPIFGYIPNSRSTTGWSAAIQKWRVRIIPPSDSIPNPFIMADGRVLTNPYKDI